MKRTKAPQDAMRLDRAVTAWRERLSSGSADLPTMFAKDPALLIELTAVALSAEDRQRFPDLAALSDLARDVVEATRVSVGSATNSSPNRSTLRRTRSMTAAALSGNTPADKRLQFAGVSAPVGAIDQSAREITAPYRKVLRFLRRGPMTFEDIEDRTVIPSRQLRAILSYLESIGIVACVTRGSRGESIYEMR